MNKDQEEKLVQMGLNIMDEGGFCRDKMRRVVRMVLELTEEESGMGDERALVSKVCAVLQGTIVLPHDAEKVIRTVREHDRPEGCVQKWLNVYRYDLSITVNSQLFDTKEEAEAKPSGNPNWWGAVPIWVPRLLTPRERTLKTLREKGDKLIDLELRAAIKEVLKMVEGESAP